MEISGLEATVDQSKVTFKNLGKEMDGDHEIQLILTDIGGQSTTYNFNLHLDYFVFQFQDFVKPKTIQNSSND